VTTILGWTFATAVGFVIVGLIPCNREGQEMYFFGALGSLPQALFLFLRGRPGKALAWPIVTALAVPLAFYFAMGTTLVGGQKLPVPEESFWLIVGCVVAGITVGVAQSVLGFGFALRPRAALRWVWASALGGPAAGAFLLILTGLLVMGPDGKVSFEYVRAVPTFPPTIDWSCSPVARSVLGLLLGALYGAITGMVLERCLRENATA
jgi:hypothetical protein